MSFSGSCNIIYVVEKVKHLLHVYYWLTNEILGVKTNMLTEGTQWETYVVSTQYKLGNMFFLAFKAFSRAIYGFKLIFRQKNFFENFWNFLSNFWRVRDEHMVKSTQKPQMGYRWNSLDPKTSKMTTKKFWPVSVLFQNHFSRFQPDQNIIQSWRSNQIQFDSYLKRILLRYVRCVCSYVQLFYFDY